MKKILYIETSQEGVPGGSYFSLLEIIRSLNRQKYKPYVIFYRENILISDFVNAGCDVFYFKRKAEGSEGIRKRSDPTLAKAVIWEFLDAICMKDIFRALMILHRGCDFGKFCSYLAKTNYIDLIHINDGITPSLPLIRELGLKNRVPIVVHERKIRNYNMIDRWFVRKIALVICISKTVFDNVVGFFGDQSRICVIYNPLASAMNPDPYNMLKLKKEFDIGVNDIVLVQISNLIHWKGQDTLISAIPMIQERLAKKRVILLLVGGAMPDETVYLEKLKRLVSMYDLQKQVKFCGFRQEKADFFSLADIVIHVPSKPEPFGRVVLEAMQMGKPVIASSEGGPAEIIQHGVTGWLVPPRAKTEICELIVSILNDRQKCHLVSNNAKSVAYKRFSIEAFSRNLDNKYRDVLFTHRFKS